MIKDPDTARRERPDFGLERGRNLVYVGRNTTIADVVKHIDELNAEIAALREAVRLAYITRGHKEDGTRTLLFRADAGVDWHFDLSADSVNAVFRALDEKP